MRRSWKITSQKISMVIEKNGWIWIKRPFRKCDSSSSAGPWWQLCRGLHARDTWKKNTNMTAKNRHGNSSSRLRHWPTTPSATVLPATCFRPIMTSEPFRNCRGTAMPEPPWSTHTVQSRYIRVYQGQANNTCLPVTVQFCVMPRFGLRPGR